MNPTVGSAEEIRWSQVEDCFFVGNHRGNFVGYIDQRSRSHFEPYDRVSTMCGVTGTLEDAMTDLANRYFATEESGDGHGS